MIKMVIRGLGLLSLCYLLAFKTTKRGAGVIYCESTCQTLINWRSVLPGTPGCISDPCENGAGKEYFKDFGNNNACTEFTLGCYTVTLP